LVRYDTNAISGANRLGIVQFPDHMYFMTRLHLRYDASAFFGRSVSAIGNRPVSKEDTFSGISADQQSEMPGS